MSNVILLPDWNIDPDVVEALPYKDVWSPIREVQTDNPRGNILFVYIRNNPNWEMKMQLPAVEAVLARLNKDLGERLEDFPGLERVESAECAADPETQFSFVTAPLIAHGIELSGIYDTVVFVGHRFTDVNDFSGTGSTPASRIRKHLLARFYRHGWKLNHVYCIEFPRYMESKSDV